ncbi:S8 family serine peptidase [Sinosporangium album]|uniref:S8 family serine peptidase n=1 Tax=Sinosporangium album TaxID=504805 RepID=UPI0015A269C1|nr:S8 family serine peptidase [Sinosporangium album]
MARRLVVQLAAPEVPTDSDEAVSSQVSAALAALPEGTTVLRGPSRTGRLVVLLPATGAETGTETGSGGDSGADVVLANVGAADASAAIDYVEPDVVDRAQLVPNDPRYPQQWAPAAVNAEAAWDLQTGASNVLIGVIDSGISLSADKLDHDDLRNASRIILGTDFVDGGTPRDLNGHGTHVAGIAAADGHNASGIAGMNWGSPLYICRTLDAAGHGSSADFADAVEEITDYAVARGLKAVINYSGGGAPNNTKQRACQYASDRGMLVVAAAGNDRAGPVIWPAAYSTSTPGVVAVGSTDPGDIVSDFSNVGPEVTVVAPGRNILSTLPTYSVSPTLPLNYGSLSGTSMATPLVSGLAALMWSRHPGHTNAKIKQCLQDSAVKLGAASFDNTWGHGRVDARAALTCGDLPILKSVLERDCPGPPKLIKSLLVAHCKSRLPVLCPVSGLIPCEIRSLVGPGCQIGGPSLIDGCPSDLLCDSRDPRDILIDPVIIGGILRRLAELERRVTGETPQADTGEGGWFYVDDNGDIHQV